jgi:hypothetical protein
MKKAKAAGYSGTPLPKKLGIREGSTVALIDAPPGFRATLGEVPESTKILSAPRACDQAIWFVKSRGQLKGRIRTVARLSRLGDIWVCWPKQESGVETDLTEDVVRDVGIANGLVDYKVCAVDDVWSGLRFAHRKPG